MKTVNENNLSTSEFQDFDELNTEELQEVAGGGLMGALAGGAIGGLAGMAGYAATWGYNNLAGDSQAFDIDEMNEKGVEGLTTGAVVGGLATLVV